MRRSTTFVLGVTVPDLACHGARYGVTRDELISRMGGSP
jgi:hypothetical protein